jgi:hypothetical protein
MPREAPVTSAIREVNAVIFDPWSEQPQRDGRNGTTMVAKERTSSMHDSIAHEGSS